MFRYNLWGDAGLVLLAEEPQRAENRAVGGAAQGAQGGFPGDLAQILEQFDIPGPALVLAQPVHDFEHLPHAFPAGHAFAAGFLAQKVQEGAGHLHHAGVFVQNQHAAGPHGGAETGEGVKIQGRVQEVLGNAAAHGTAEVHRLELLVSRNAAADIEDDLPQRGSHGHFHHGRVLDMAGDRDQLGPFAFLRANAGVPCVALVDDQGHVGPGFHVVQVTGFVPDTAHRGADVLGPRLRILALDGAHQGAGFAGDEDAHVKMDFHMKVEAGTQDVVAQEAVFLGLGQGRVDVFLELGHVMPGVDEPLAGADGKGTDDQPLDDVVRIAGEDGAVHERPGLAFVPVDDHVFLLAGGVAGRFPFETGGEAAAAAAAQVGRLDLVQDTFRGHLEKGLGKGRVPADGEIVLDLLGIDQRVGVDDHAGLLFIKRNIGLVNGLFPG
ncbi:hypothetical protein DESC_100024 [Desulfosarcina cetonica]|nr:hypothetical protein DESC_100024 [Desulfosarcina cetonica]